MKSTGARKSREPGVGGLVTAGFWWLLRRLMSPGRPHRRAHQPDGHATRGPRSLKSERRPKRRPDGWGEAGRAEGYSLASSAGDNGSLSLPPATWQSMSTKSESAPNQFAERRTETRSTELPYARLRFSVLSAEARGNPALLSPRTQAKRRALPVNATVMHT